MEGLKALVPMLPLLLPLLGKLLLMAPIIPNKAIPFINAAVATAAKYWYLLGFGAAVPAAADVGLLGDQVMQAGFIGDLGRGAIALGWGCVDALGAHYFYEGKRLLAAKAGKVSWLEKGKRDIFSAAL